VRFVRRSAEGLRFFYAASATFAADIPNYTNTKGELQISEIV
jgi:hypothetical protein